MKKLSITLCTCLALSGCMFGFNADVDSAEQTRQNNRAAYRAEFGCPLTDDHEAYRECLLNTYYGTHPKTYQTATEENGKSVAIVKNETRTTYDKDTDTYKTERVIVIETEEKLVPVSAPTPVPVPAVPVEKETIIEEEIINEPEIEVTAAKEEVPTKPVVEAPRAVEPEPAQTWWDTYQRDKIEEAEMEPECPCPDPNDPCPQCVDK